MSIIYDALKKVEQSGAAEAKSAPVAKPEKIRKFKIKIYLVYGLLVCSGLLIGNAVFAFFTREKKIAPPVLPTKPVISQPLPPPVASLPQKADIATPPQNQPRPGLILNGVFFSGNDGYALINNQIVREGDLVGGALVKRISLGEVELESAGSVTVLTTTSK